MFRGIQKKFCGERLSSVQIEIDTVRDNVAYQLFVGTQFWSCREKLGEEYREQDVKLLSSVIYRDGKRGFDNTTFKAPLFQ